MRTLIALVLLGIVVLGVIGIAIWAVRGHAKDENRITAKNAKRVAEEQRRLIRKIEDAALEEQRIGFNEFAQIVLNQIEDHRKKELNR
ncbi:MAG TPA: hypothetical protein VHK27_13780 [Gammaproteobacteria bacterium]|nr:hypothetical protein [Gammaproteobacteria bacterium]